MSAITHLLVLADRYQEATQVEAKTLSWRVFGDSKKLDALRAGKDIQVRRYEQAMQWFGENWPEGAKWPADVPAAGSAAA